MSKVTDPNLLAILNADEESSASAPASAKVTDPAILAELNKQPKIKYQLKNGKSITLPTPEELASTPTSRFALNAAGMSVGLSQLIDDWAKKNVDKFPMLSWPMLAGMKARELLGIPNLGESHKESLGLAEKGLEGKTDISGFAGKVFDPLGLGITRAVKLPATKLGRIAQSGGVGSFYATLQPFQGKDGDLDVDKLADAVVGAVVGGTVGTAMEGARFGGKMVSEYFTQAGAKDVSVKMLETILGKDNFYKLVESVEKRLPSIGKGPLHDYKPTTGELAADLPEAGPLLALQYKLSKGYGGPSAVFETQKQANQAAVSRALGTIAGSQDDLANALSHADAIAKANYGPIMGQRVSGQSDAGVLSGMLNRARGTPQWQPAEGSGPFVGRAGAMQQWGKAVTDEAQQTALANNWMPVPGMPRVAGRYSPNIEVADQARSAAREALYAAGTRGKEAEFIESLMVRLENQGMLAMDSINPLVSRPSMVKAINYARKLAQEPPSGKPYSFPKSLKDDFTVQNLHDIKLGLDNEIRKGSMKDPITGASALDNATLAGMAKTRDAFIRWIESKVPAYGQARVEYSKAMVPVNQMRIGQELKDRLTTEVTGNENPRAFLRAIEEGKATVKRATGQSRQELGQGLNPRQMETVDEVGRILERQVQSLSPQRRATIPGNSIDEQIGVELPSILSRPVVLANWLLKKAHKGKSPVERRAEEIMTFWMTNPEKFVEAIKTMNKQEQLKIARVLKSGGITNLHGMVPLNLVVEDAMDWNK